MSHLCDMSARADIRAVTAENVRCALLLLSSKGQHCPFAGDNVRKIRRKCCYRHTLIRTRSGLCQLNSLSRIRPCLLAWAHLIRRLSATPSPRNTVTFGQVRKALLYIKILCQHNRSRAKSNSDHQNSYFAAMPAAGVFGKKKAEAIAAALFLRGGKIPFIFGRKHAHGKDAQRRRQHGIGLMQAEADQQTVQTRAAERSDGIDAFA